MEQNRTEEELYVAHQTKLRSLEQNLEGLERRNKKFEQKKERSQTQMRQNQERIEESIIAWGRSGESDATRTILEEYLGEEKAELKKEEEGLQEEYKQIRGEQSQCEEAYQEEWKKLQEEVE